MPKPVKQKVSVADVHKSHDIYGISATAGDEKTADEDLDDGDSLCVICLSGASLCSPCTYLRTTHYCGLFTFGLFMFTHYFCCLLLFPHFNIDELRLLLYFLVAICASAQIVRSRSGPKATNVLYAADLSKVFAYQS